MHAPPNEILRIDQLWAFVSSDETGEGLCAAPLLPGMMVPMVGADEERVNSMKRIARAMATQSGKKIKLIKFSVREEIMEFEP